jgi:hypothetical protein
MLIGCDDGQLSSISVQEKKSWLYWIFIGTVKKIKNGKYDFVISEAYKESSGLRASALQDDFVESDDLLYVDTMFFKKGRKVFLRIHGSLRDTVLQLNKKLVTLNKKIKIADIQKMDIFTSDSIKILGIIINRRSGLASINFVKVKGLDFHASLIGGEFIIQFNCRVFPWRLEPECCQYKFRIPVSTENTIRE